VRPQPRRATRQVRTGVPGIAGWGRGDEGYLDVFSEEMSQTFTILSVLPLTSPALRHLWSRLRSLPAGLRYGSAHQTCPRLRRPT